MVASKNTPKCANNTMPWYSSVLFVTQHEELMVYWYRGIVLMSDGAGHHPVQEVSTSN
jgi:hypothetical protein